ncbi:MAG: hypothetical protein IJ111_01260 [Eggerthellaceae bacterium]|nr:hypothetical protein [Eggerthellaceae bacterium]
MDERLEKYYDGRSCEIGLDRSSAIAAFASLLNGETQDGRLFDMTPDSLMEEFLYPEDYAFWLESKRLSAIA